MKKYTIEFCDYKYDYIYSKGPSLIIKDYLSEIDKLIMISDSGVPKEILEIYSSFLMGIRETEIVIFPEGEVNKSLLTVANLCEELIEIGADRRTAIVAVGGGLVGNVAGMVAALLYRGIPLIHIPTTLMAASDSVLSLKQAVNLQHGKNLVGTFYKPSLVYVDSLLLVDQDPRSIRNAIFELVKNALAIIPEDIRVLSNLLNSTNRYSSNQLESLIDYCIKAKSKVMKFDAYEQKDGVVLEYGHTIGHAIELAAEGRLMHGESVAFGMLVAARVSYHLGFLKGEDLITHNKMINLIGYDNKDHPTLSEVENSIKYLKNDNKKGYVSSSQNEIGLVLLERLGEVKKKGSSFITNVSLELIVDEMIKIIKQEEVLI
ncbi:3-dehydroquinate synthase family protein [Virgibacillus pantothenticus]|uniref:3-dehydroquinate synthase family protein n=1 Tax=Virgibacillus pantothenticus TaxID=1473 RepID=UPI000985FD69|nr:iron-containing alcohol dehydrogenase [Virgibacillus pantothenticus]